MMSRDNRIKFFNVIYDKLKYFDYYDDNINITIHVYHLEFIVHTRFGTKLKYSISSDVYKTALINKDKLFLEELFSFFI